MQHILSFLSLPQFNWYLIFFCFDRPIDNWFLKLLFSFFLHIYNLFKLFFLASVFLLSVWTFAATKPSFFGIASAPAAPSAGGGRTFWSWPFGPGILEGGVDGAESRGILPPETMFDWSTFRAVVDSEMPAWHLGLGLSAWIAVYNLHWWSHKELIFSRGKRRSYSYIFVYHIADAKDHFELHSISRQA